MRMLLVAGVLVAGASLAGGKPNVQKPERRMCGGLPEPERPPEKKCGDAMEPTWLCWYDGPKYGSRWVATCQMRPG